MSLANLMILGAFALGQTGGKVSTFEDAFRLLSSEFRTTTDADSLRAYLGADLPKGVNPPNEDLRYIFAISTPTSDKVRAVSDDPLVGEPWPHDWALASGPRPILEPRWSIELPRVAGTDVHAAAVTLPFGLGMRWHYEVGAARFGGGELEALAYPPEAKAKPGVPKGQLLEQPEWKSKVFDGTTRKWWIYVPAQYDPARPACLFVVQDAQWQRGYWTQVMENLIAQKDIPVSIGVFLTPGTKDKEWDNRSVEYDTVSDAYVRMLSDEILPEVQKKYNIRPEGKAHLIAGASSGAICAFNAAWQRPELFQKVVSWIGSYTNLQGGPSGFAGGNTFPAMIREHRGWDKKGEPKPIRVFLQDGLNDVDNRAGNWPLANQEMARALEFGGYDYKFVLGQGFHSDRLGQVLLPDVMRWMWRDEPK